MNSTPVPFTQRVLASALLVTLAVSLYLGAWVPLAARHARVAAEIEAGHDRLARLQRLAAAKTDLAAALARFERDDPGAHLLWGGETPAVAAADLQERIKALVAEHGGSLLSTSTQPPSTERDLTRIGVNARLTIANGGLRNWLHDLEAGAPLAFIDKLAVRTQARTMLANQRDDPVLYVDASVTGYTRAPLAEDAVLR